MTSQTKSKSRDFKALLLASFIGMTVAFAGCSNTSDLGPANDPAPAPAPAKMVPLTLTGIVSRADGSSLGGGTVRSQIGTKFYPGTLGTDGKYTVIVPDITGLDTTAMTAIEYIGTASKPLTLVSLTGTLGSLLKLQDASSTVPMTKLTSLGVTSFSTAQYGGLFGSISTKAAPIAKDAAALTFPATTDAALSAALANENPNDIINTAALIELIAAGTVSLPSGYSDTTALVMNTQALASAVMSASTSNPDAFNTATQQVTTANGATPVASGFTVPATAFFVPSHAGQFNVASPYASDLRFNPDLTGSVNLSWGSASNYSNSSNAAYTNRDTFTWSLTGKIITVKLDHGLTLKYSYISSYDSNDNPVYSTEADTLSSLYYTLYDVNGTTLPGREDLVYTTQIDGGTPTQVDTRPNQPFGQVGNLIAYTSTGGGFTAGELTGKSLMLQLYYGGSQSTADILTFKNDGTGQGQISGNFTWSVDTNGFLVIASKDSGGSSKYFKTTSQGSAGEYIVGYLTDTGTPSTNEVNAGIAVPVDPTFQLTETNVVGDWLSEGLANSGYVSSTAGTIDELVYAYNADKTATSAIEVTNCTVAEDSNNYEYLTTPCAGTASPAYYDGYSVTRNRTWSVATAASNGINYLNALYNGNNSSYYHSRTEYPVTKVPNTNNIFVLELLIYSDSDDPNSSYYSARTRLYDIEPSGSLMTTIAPTKTTTSAVPSKRASVKPQQMVHADIR